MRELILQSWYKRGSFITWLLAPLALLYRCIFFVRRLFYRCGIFKTFKAQVPVIIVGNFTVGGTGKTPIVIALAKALQSKGYIPGIVSRGYRAQVARNHEVTGKSMPEEAGDEPLLIHAATGAPVMVNPRRSDAAAALQSKVNVKVNVIISDDGLQHYALARDIEWAVTDHRRSGNGWLLPAGPLREQPRAVDAVLVTSGTVNEDEWAIRSLLGDAYAAQDKAQTRPMAQFKSQCCAAVAGIGEPERFFDSLRAQGIKLVKTVALPDHHDYASNPFADIKAEIIFITEKDAIKCAAMDKRLWVVPLNVILPDALIAQTMEKLRRLSP